ncbi:thioesterase family protein [Oceanicoccus sp. KOV_DT_Chl]|uniref:acyl-CoA thioesterase n=1 Tax=Oceanicoccus sp. KOV_DT_Chl TaxID=1904639 RepID=UPI000C7A934E|nr:thioesterase family protein [Oceanicoccus sp. KOV_DT_Chl]
MAKRPALAEASVTITVPFHDVDMMTYAWHGHYVKYFEIARCELLNKIDYNYLQMHDSGYMWPVIDMRIQYVRPAKFGMDVIVKASLVEYENRLRIDFLITDAETGLKLTKAYTCQVAVDMATQEMCFVSPAILAQKLGLEQ